MDTSITGSGYSGGCFAQLAEAAATGAGAGDDDFLHTCYHSTYDNGGDDLFELAMEELQRRPLSPVPVVTAEMLYAVPPSEEEMAAWLYPIVRGEELQVDNNGHVRGQNMVVGDHQVPSSKEEPKKSKYTADQKLPETEKNCAKVTNSDSNERTKTRAGGAKRSRHYSETHSLTEKRRRCKVTERFKTLQQLVPGCQKCNQASTLDQTIKYMKSLQQQLQYSMASIVGCSMRPACMQPPVAVTATPPMPPPPAGMLPTTVPDGAPAPMLLPPAHHPVLIVPAQFIHRPPPATAAPNVL